MAEREGFEPSVELSPYTRLAGERLQPTRPSLRKFLAQFNCNTFERNPEGEKRQSLKSLLINRKSRGGAGIGGGSRIRTHGTSRHNGFQDRRLQPLGHPS